MHHSRLCAVLIDCKTSDVDEAARFWGEALGRPVDTSHPGSRGNYRMLETPPDEPIVQIQRVGHESRVHIDIETDDIPAEVTRLGETRRQGGEPPGALGGDASAHRPTLLRRTGTASRFPKECQPVGLRTDVCHLAAALRGRRLARDALVPALSRILRLALLAPD